MNATITATPTIIDTLTGALDLLVGMADAVARLQQQTTDLRTQLDAARLECSRLATTLEDSPDLHETAVAATRQVLQSCQAADVLASDVGTVERGLASVVERIEAAADLAGGQATGALSLPSPEPVPMASAAQVTVAETEPLALEEPLVVPDLVLPRQAPAYYIQPDMPADVQTCPTSDAVAEEPVPTSSEPESVADASGALAGPVPAGQPEQHVKRGRKRANPGSKAATLLIGAASGEEAVQGLVEALQAAGRGDLIELLARVAVEALPTTTPTVV